MTTADALDQGRESFGRQAWADAFDPLGIESLPEGPAGGWDVARLGRLDRHREGKAEDFPSVAR